MNTIANRQLMPKDKKITKEHIGEVEGRPRARAQCG